MNPVKLDLFHLANVEALPDRVDKLRRPIVHIPLHRIGLEACAVPDKCQGPE